MRTKISLGLLSLGLLSARAYGIPPLDQELLNTAFIGEPPQSVIPPQIFDANRLAQFESLIEQGANINATDQAGDTPLIQLCRSVPWFTDQDPQEGYLRQAITYALSKGADANAVNNDGRSCVFLVFYDGSTSTQYGGEAPDDPAIADIVINNQPTIDWNQSDVLGETALFWTVQASDAVDSQYLLNHGANLGSTDNLGQNISYQAVVGTTVSTLNLVEGFVPPNQRKAFFNAPSSALSTPFLSAVNADDFAVATYLLDTYGADPRVRNVEDMDALYYVRRRFHSPYVTGAHLAQEKAFYKKIKKIDEALGPTAQQIESEIYRDHVRCDGPNYEPMNFGKMRDIVEFCGIKKLDDLVPLLPKSILANRVLFYSPRGFIGGSASHPSVVSVAREGDFYMGFGGDPNLPGYNNLDMIQLKKDGNKERFEIRTYDFSGKRPKLSRANPTTCTECHGTNPRPMFDTYNLWPGLYGSEGEVYPAEKAMYNSQFVPNSTQGRYQSLPGIGDSYIVTPEGEIPDPEFRLQRMDELIVSRTNEVMMSQLATEQDLKPFKFAILGALSCMDPIESFFPAAMAGKAKRTFDELKTETVSVGVGETENRLQRLVAANPGAPQSAYILQVQENIATDSTQSMFQDVDRVARLRYILQFVGSDVDWSTVFSPNLDGAYRYVIRELTDYEMTLFALLLDPNDPDESAIRQLFVAQKQTIGLNSYNYGLFRGPDYYTDLGVDSTQVCSSLKAASLKALGAI